MEISEDFNVNNYVHIQNFIDKEMCEHLTEKLKKEIEQNGWNDIQSIRGSLVSDKLLVDMLPNIEEITNLKLLPISAYARWYVPGKTLNHHRDIEAGEISVTLTLGFDGDPWPIFIADHSDDQSDTKIVVEKNQQIHVKNISKIPMSVGDAIVYKENKMYHWREEYNEGKWQVQLSLHYADVNGPYVNLRHETKSRASEKNDNVKTETDLTYWYYNDVFSSEDCDMIVSTLLKNQKEKALIGENGKLIVDETIRKVDKILLPTYKGIGGILTSVGLNANSQRWKFDIKTSNQCEFLHYPSGGGRYKGHMDTFLSNRPDNLESCRKLTVLAFLNDDFKGGKFFLQTGSERFYPPQRKGYVLVFPSFLLHGVEDVEEGDRYSVVCWLVGPWFK